MVVPLGSIRVLQIGLGINDAGFTRGLARANSRIRAFEIATGQAGRRVGHLNSQLTLLGTAGALAIAAAGREFAQFERQTTLAAFAAGGFAENVGRIRAEARGLARDFKTSPQATSILLQQIAQLGLRDAQLQNALARASLGLELATGGEVGAEQAAAILFRLDTAVGELEGDFRGLASAIVAVGDATAAGIPGLTEQVRALQSFAIITGAAEAEVVALAGALTNLDETQKRTFGTAAQRIFSTRVVKDPAAFARFLGISQEAVTQAAQDDPFAFLMSLALQTAQLEPGQRPGALRGLGLEQRDIALVATLAAETGNLSRFLALANESIQDPDGVLGQRTRVLLQQLSAQWTDFTGQLRSAAITIGSVLAPALQTLLRILAGIAEFVANPAVAATLVLGGGGALGFGAARAARGGGFVGNLIDIATLGLLTRGAGGGRFAAIRGRFGAAGAARAGTAFANIPGAARAAGGPGGVRAAQSLGFLGLGGVAGRLGTRAAAGGLLGRGAGGLLRAGGTRLGGLALGPIGIIVSLLSAVEPIFRRLAEGLRSIGERGGVAGVIFNSLAIAFGLVARAGNVINAVFDKVIEFFGAVFRLIGKIPGVDALSNFLGNVADVVTPGRADPTRAGGRAPVTNNISVNLGSNDSANAQVLTGFGSAGGTTFLS